MREEVVYAIFMELQKVCGALDKYICLENLEGYSMGPQVFRILRVYWDLLRMVVRTRGYYETAFQGFQEVA